MSAKFFDAKNASKYIAISEALVFGKSHHSSCSVTVRDIVHLVIHAIYVSKGMSTYALEEEFPSMGWSMEHLMVVKK